MDSVGIRTLEVYVALSHFHKGTFTKFKPIRPITDCIDDFISCVDGPYRSIKHSK